MTRLARLAFPQGPPTTPVGRILVRAATPQARHPGIAGGDEELHADSVVDIDRWLSGKAERAAVFAAFSANVTDYAAVDGSNDVAITGDVDDMAGAQAMMETPSPEAAATGETHGVMPPLAVYIEK
jgi:hypothetical protein